MSIRDAHQATRNHFKQFGTLDVVVAFVGQPHRIDDRGAQVLKSLKYIGFEDYYQAEITGWVRALPTLPSFARSRKATDEFLDPLFRNFFERLGLPALLRKADYHELARYVAPDVLDGEVRDVLDAIRSTAQSATPRR